MSKNFGGLPHSSGIVLDSTNNHVARLFHRFQGVVHSCWVDDVGCCVALGASPLTGAEFSYAREVLSCPGVNLGLQAEYVVCKAGERFKACVCLSSFANAGYCFLAKKVIVSVNAILSID